MSQESIIRYYNRLNGNSISIETLKDFRSRVERHIDSHGSGPNITDMRGILVRVTRAIKTLIETGASVVERVELTPVELKEAKQISTKAEKPKPVKVEVKKPEVRKPISIPGRAKKKKRIAIIKKVAIEPPSDQTVVVSKVPAKSATGISASNLAGMEFKTLPFTGKWKDHFGTPSENFSAMVWGKPKQGKTHYSFQFANHLSQYGNVLYVLSDEGIGYTVKEKIISNGLDKNDKVSFIESRELSEIENVIKQGDVKFVFIDLISNVKVNGEDLKPKDFHSLKKRYPSISFIPVFASTKSGNFRGEQDWGHDVDVLVDVSEGVASGSGRFGGGSEYEIFKKDNKVKAQDIAPQSKQKNP